jgi:oligoendopeptidase F
LQRKTRKNKNFMNKVKEFLSAGTSESPREIFSKMGIDISNKKFWNDGLKVVERLLNEAEILAKKLGKI